MGELGKLWEGVLGRYDKAVEGLVTDTLCECENPVEKLANAITQMKTPESAKRVIQAVQKGIHSSLYVCFMMFNVSFSPL